MNESEDRLLRRSVVAYRLILHLYPRGFRDAFGNSMADTFERLIEGEIRANGTWGVVDVWKSVAGELLPTVVRAHLDEACCSRFPLPVRVGFAAVLPATAYAFAVGVSTTTGQSVVLTLWLALLAAAMLIARGRGWRCSVNAMVASGVGILIPALNDVFNGRMPPESVRVIPLLVSAGATIGLIISVYVRFFIEGVRLRRVALA